MKYRSPKWLRNIIDFEISTGADITGKPSKRAIRKAVKAREAERRRVAEQKRKEEEALEREKERNRKARWNMRWRTKDDESFKDFYSKVHNRGRMIWHYDMDDIKSKWKYNDDLWTEYDSYVKKKREEEEKQKRQEKQINDLWDEILSDWKYNKYDDKIKTDRNPYTGQFRWTYTMENGDVITFCDNELKTSRMSWTFGLLYQAKFQQLFNHIVKEVNNGYASKRSGKRRSYSSKYKSRSRKNSSHPKRGLYDSILDTISQREEQLKGMRKNDPDRKSLENELEAAKTRAKIIKDKYKF